jgi:hypothetical protein
VIPTVTAALTELGVLESGSNLRFNFGLTKGDTLWTDAYVDRRHYFHVKLSDVVSLRDEARVHAEAYGWFADLMPRSLGYCVRNGWELFVTEGVPHRQFFRGDLLDPRRARKWIPEICRFFQRSRLDPLKDSQGAACATLLESLEASFKDSQFGSILALWCSGPGLRELEALGVTRQHCDFVANNLGVAGSRLVVFDWEDFGRISLPGLDLCTLVVSCVNGDTDIVLANGGSALANRCSIFVNPACAALDMDVSLFWRLVPLYLLTFLYLKNTYGRDIRIRITALLSKLLASDPSRRIAG